MDPKALTTLCWALTCASAASPLGVFDGPSDGLFDGAAVGLPSGCQSDWVAVSGASRMSTGTYRKLEWPEALNGTDGRPSYKKTGKGEQRYIFFSDNMWVLGPQLGGEPFELAVASTARDPTAVASLWSIVAGRDQGAVNAFTVRCTTAVPTPAPTPSPTPAPVVALRPIAVTLAPTPEPTRAAGTVACARITIRVDSWHNAAVRECAGDYFITSTDDHAAGRAVRTLQQGGRMMWFRPEQQEWVVSARKGEAPYYLGIGSDSIDPPMSGWHAVDAGNGDGVHVSCSTASPTPSPTVPPTAQPTHSPTPVVLLKPEGVQRDQKYLHMQTTTTSAPEPHKATSMSAGSGVVAAAAHAAPHIVAAKNNQGVVLLDVDVAGPREIFDVFRAMVRGTQMARYRNALTRAIARTTDPLGTINAGHVQLREINIGTGWRGACQANIRALLIVPTETHTLGKPSSLSIDSVINTISLQGFAQALQAALRARLGAGAAKLVVLGADAKPNAPEPVSHVLTRALNLRDFGPSTLLPSVAAQHTACSRLSMSMCKRNRERCVLAPLASSKSHGPHCELDAVHALELVYSLSHEWQHIAQADITRDRTSAPPLRKIEIPTSNMPHPWTSLDWQHVQNAAGGAGLLALVALAITLSQQRTAKAKTNLAAAASRGSGQTARHHSDWEPAPIVSRSKSGLQSNRVLRRHRGGRSEHGLAVRRNGIERTLAALDTRNQFDDVVDNAEESLLPSGGAGHRGGVWRAGAAAHASKRQWARPQTSSLYAQVFEAE